MKEHSKLMNVLRVHQLSVGCWPLYAIDGIKSIRYQIYSTIVNILYTVKIILEITYICNHSQSVTETGANLIVFLTGLEYQLRVIFITYFKRNMAEMFIEFRDVIHMENIENCNEIAKRAKIAAEKEGKIFIYLFITLFIWGFIFFFSIPIIFNQKNGANAKNTEVPKALPYSLALPYDYEFNNLYYYITFIAEAFYGYVCISSLVCHDSIVCYFILHMLGQLKVLRNSVETITKISEDEDEIESKDLEPESWRKYTKAEENLIYNNIRECLLHYRSLLRFVDMIQNNFGFIYLISFFNHMICICLLGLQIASTNTESNFKFALFFVGDLSRLVLTCVYVNRLVEKSLELSRAIYFCDWITLSKRCNMTLLFFLTRTQYPMQLTAMGFVNISLETMTTILKSSFSYFTLLRSLDE